MNNKIYALILLTLWILANIICYWINARILHLPTNIAIIILMTYSFLRTYKKES